MIYKVTTVLWSANVFQKRKIQGLAGSELKAALLDLTSWGHAFLKLGEVGHSKSISLLQSSSIRLNNKQIYYIMCFANGYRWVCCYCCLSLLFWHFLGCAWALPTAHTERFPRRCNLQWPKNASSPSTYEADWGGPPSNSLWTRLRTIFLLKGGLTGRPPASCTSFLSNVAGVCQLRKHRAICGRWKRSPRPALGLRDGLLFPGMSHILSEPR